jgi:hypothetical protein
MAMVRYAAWLVGGGDHDDSPGEAFGAKGLLNKLPHLPASFADQTDHHRIAARLTRQHRQEHALADARSGEDAKPLASAAGGEDVHGADAKIKALSYPASRVGGGRRGAEGISDGPLRQRPLAVDGLAEGVDDAAAPR